MKRQVSSGFTLIEILVVMVLLGILSTIGIQSFLTSQKKGRDTQRKEALQNIGKALELYYNDKGSYPSSDGSGNIMACGAGATAVCTWGSIWQDTTTGTIYMPLLGKDPLTTQHYFYLSAGSPPSKYYLYAKLENTQDSAIITPAQSNNCSGANNCNYGIASPNATP